MRRICLSVNRRKPEAPDIALRFARAIGARGFEAFGDAWLSATAPDAILPLDAPIGEGGGLPDGCEAIVAVGGDGTLLNAVRPAVLGGVPVLGVNLGRLGFLTEVERGDVEAAARRFALGDYTLERRMLLSVRAPKMPDDFALNDAVVSRGGYARLITVEAYVGGELVGRYVADGLIVSTPTGSTGYSLSAGGPIVSPSVHCVVLSPICAHSLSHRPVVIGDDRPITVTVTRELEQDVQLSLDGRMPFSLPERAEIVISRDARDATFVRLSGQPFFERARRKLSEWSA